MKIKYLLISAILSISILCFGISVNAQNTSSSGVNQPCYAFNSNLSRGISSQDVFNLQTLLIKNGFLNISQPTSYFGNLTFNAVVAFQRVYGISQIGAVGPITRTKLNSLYGCGINPPPTCTPNWQCGWGPCINGSHVETMTDLNNCG